MIEKIIQKTFHVNQVVQTPNGPGIVQGHMWEDGRYYVIVRHRIAEMTGKSAGTCQTPLSTVTALWSYSPDHL